MPASKPNRSELPTREKLAVAVPSIRFLHATIRHALGLDQHELVYDHHNRRELVTVNGGQVVREVFGEKRS